MRTTQDILFGVSGQALTFDAPEGRPSSVVSVEIFENRDGDDGTAEDAIGGFPTIETNPNTTLDAASGFGQADRRRVALTATTGIEVGRTYLLADGSREWIEVVDVASADSVTARYPLQGTYDIGATFQSTRITQALDAVWAADENNLSGDDPNGRYRVRWQYIVDGATYVHDSYFDLRRYSGSVSLSALDVEALVPGWIDRLPLDHRRDQGARLLREAHRAVKLDLHAIDREDAGLANAEIVDELVRYKAIELSEWANAFARSGSDFTRHDEAKKAYSARFDALVRIVSRVPQRSSTGAASPRIATNLSSR